MSFFRSGNTSTPPPQPNQYNRPPEVDYRSQRRLTPQPPGQYNYSHGYNDPSGAIFEKSAYPRKPPPSHTGGSFGVVGAPSDAFALSNCLAVNPYDFPDGIHVLVNKSFPLTVRHDRDGKVQAGYVGASQMQRQWIGLSLTGDQATVERLPDPPHQGAPGFVQAMDIEVGFLKRGVDIAEVYSADDMAKKFAKAFVGTAMTTEQTVVFEYHGQNLKGLIKSVVLLEVPGRPPSSMKNTGIISETTDVAIMKSAESTIKIKSSAKRAPPNAILAPNFKFEDMGIGGLDSEFSDIFRRAFASRVFPPALVEKLGIQHVKGLVLHGPPGTGKTLIARQIGKMLNAREPKIVNGPEILSKFVGASEENIRKLFADAEKEYKEKADESGLHIIIFDELDAIFKHRGSTNNGTGVGDTVVNQLLSKLDGVDQLNNILVIGMTNRLDMIDEALLRPGRLEVHMEISLPDEKGRYQILNIHTYKMQTNGVLDDDVDLVELASLTKNFSGAEITGLIKSATSFAFNRHVKVGTMAGISDDVENLRVNRDDFMRALSEVHPAFGVSEEELQQVIQNGIIHYSHNVDELLKTGNLFVEQVRTSTRTPLVSILLHGPPGSGKTALGVSIAQASGYPFIKLLSPDNMVGYSESQKVAAITKVFTDSYKSPLSVVVVDNIERLIDWTPMGARFSNSVLQTMLVLFSRRPPKGRRLLIIATSSLRPLLTDLGFSENFDSELRVPPISTLRSLDHVLQEVKLFPSDQHRKRAIRMLEDAGFAGNDELDPKLQIGIKRLMSIIEMARQEPDTVAERLISSLIALR